MRLIAILAATIALTSPAFAQQVAAPAPACATMDVALPGNLDDWNGKAAITTAASASDIASTTLTPGKGYEARLAPRDKVTFTLEPEKPGGSVSYSGLFRFDVPTDGNYSIALGTAAWIDVLEDGKALEPVSFGHGPECTTIRKIVIFKMKPGRHVLQVAGNGAATLKVMVASTP